MVQRARVGMAATRGSEEKKKTSIKRCFKCGEREHVGANCPTKTLGAKCFGCGERGHIASRCPKEGNAAERSVVASVLRISRKKYTREVVLNDRIIVALIDTGSDISIMRASEYAMIGSPGMQASDTEFCGVGGYSTKALGEFQTHIIIDEHVYPIFIRVVPNTVL